MNRTKSLKPRKCRVCPTVFEPRNSLHIVRGQPCALVHARAAEARKQARVTRAARRQQATETRAAKLKLMRRSDWVKRVQVAFNRFIRLRDQSKPCICCDKPLSQGGLTGGGYDAGHYRSVGSAPHLRFVEDNCHAQRKVCNQFGAGRAVDYRIGLIKRIGLARVEAIEADQADRKHSIDELRELEKYYRARARELTGDRADGHPG